LSGLPPRGDLGAKPLYCFEKKKTGIEAQEKERSCPSADRDSIKKKKRKGGGTTPKKYGKKRSEKLEKRRTSAWAGGTEICARI